MSSRFRVGELVIMQHARFFHEYEGAPAIVTGGLRRRHPIDLKSMKSLEYDGYEVRILAGDGQVANAEPHQLRKLRDIEHRQFSRALEKASQWNRDLEEA